VGFEGGKAIAEVGGGAVECCAGEATHRGDGGAEGSADLAVEEVSLGIAQEAELEDEVLEDEATTDDSYSAGLC
jgi:hypothetical protein